VTPEEIPMQEQISDAAPDTETTDPVPGRPWRSERADTTYVILEAFGERGGAWQIVAPLMAARSTREALQTYVEALADKPANGTVLVAVASRSWKPTTVGIKTETITRVVIDL
jgi:hypothetical protein